MVLPLGRDRSSGAAPGQGVGVGVARVTGARLCRAATSASVYLSRISSIASRTSSIHVAVGIATAEPVTRTPRSPATIHTVNRLGRPISAPWSITNEAGAAITPRSRR